MKMNAWMVPMMKTSKSFQITSGIQAATSGTSLKMMNTITTPAKMLPKSRSARLKGLVISSTMLINTKGIRIAGLASKGLVKRRR